jgi:iron complex transport system ATP-binding protein
LRLGRSPYWHAFGLETDHDLDVVEQVAELLELKDLLRRPMEQLSGGQRQRVFIGRCLVQEPRALLLDEPNTFLDLRHQVDLLRILRRLADQRNLTILMASHDLNLAGAFADRLTLLSQGRVVITGSPGDVLQSDTLEKVYGVAMQRIDRPGQTPVVVPAVF